MGDLIRKEYIRLIWQKTIRKNIYEPARTYQACGEAWWGLSVPTHQHSPTMLCRGQGNHLLHKPRSGNGTEVSGPLGNLRHATEHMYPWEDRGSRFRTLL